MNWDAIGAVGELVGAVAVVVTLAYLAFQIKHNRLTAESNAVEKTGAGLNSVNVNIMNNPELAEIWVKGFLDPDSLSEIQNTRFWFLTQSYLNHFSTIKKHYDTGALAEEDWQALARSFAHIFNAPGGRQACERAAVSPGSIKLFRDYLKYKDYEREGYAGITSYEKPE